MSLRKKLGKLLLCVFLEAAALSGARITPEEIEKLMQMSDTQVLFVVKNDDEDRQVDPPA
jgi:hypothetical protein